MKGRKADPTIPPQLCFEQFASRAAEQQSSRAAPGRPALSSSVKDAAGAQRFAELAATAQRKSEALKRFYHSPGLGEMLAGSRAVLGTSCAEPRASCNRGTKGNGMCGVCSTGTPEDA